MKKYIFLLFIFVIIESLNASGGSIYSRYGIGDLHYTYSARKLALGEIGVAVADVDYLSSNNPASWYRLQLTRLEAGLIFKGMDIKDNTKNIFYSETIFSGFMMGFPLDKDYGITLVVGILPYSNVNYEVNEKVENTNSGNFLRNYTGDGGLTKAFFGTSYKFPFDFSIGANFEYYSGNFDYQSTIEFEELSQFNGASFITNNSYRGIGFNMGIISGDASNFIGIDKLTEFRFGAMYNYLGTLKVDTTFTKITALGTIEIENGIVDSEIPFRLGLGTSFIWDNDYLFMFDYMYQPWAKYTFDNVKSDQLQDLQRLSLGIEYRNPTARYGSLWEQIILRGGLSFEQTQYKINGKGINQFAFHSGFSLPLGLYNTVDIGLVYGIRGTTDNNLLKENFFKASVTLSFGELWFIRQER